MSNPDQPNIEKPYVRLQGIGASPGITIGKVFIWDKKTPKIHKICIREEDVPAEMDRLRNGIARAEEEISQILKDIPDELIEYGEVFQSHLLMLRDRMIREQAVGFITKEHINAEWALSKALDRVRELFRTVKDPYIRERIKDVEFAVDRVLRILTGKTGDWDLGDLENPVVVVSHDLSPEDTIQLDPGKILALVTDMGSRTSHTAILARSLGIPAVVGLEHATSAMDNDDTVIVDGVCGTVHVSPDGTLIEALKVKQADFIRYQLDIIHSSHLPAETIEGHRIRIKANIELTEELRSVIGNGAEGVGLLRTEYLYLAHKELPPEETLFETYREIAEKLHPYPVTIRTLDIGGDKFVSHVTLAPEINPALGLRAIRLSLKEPRLFRTQLRAILRASAFGKVRILFPLVSGIEEIREAKVHLDQVMNDLERDGIPFDSGIRVGIMIEVPSAVMIADILAKEVDFFSIGTNDLIQYSLAIDRVNEHVAHLYNPLHPGIIRMIHRTVEAAHGAGIEVAMCGEMAGEPTLIPVLIGLGIDELSMNAQGIPHIKRMVRRCRYDACIQLVRELLEAPSADDIQRMLTGFVAGHLPSERNFITLCPIP